MSNAMTNQSATSFEGAGIGKDGIGLTTFCPHLSGVKIDEVSVIAGNMFIVIDTMRVMADRAGDPSAIPQVQAVSTFTTCGVLFE